jgi:precorrin-6B methylase 2
MEDQDYIIKLLVKRGANKNCQRCGHSNFTLLEGNTSLALDLHQGNAIILGGNKIPSAVVVCNNCGNLNIHSIRVLESD